jgi:hypothetical protein
MLFPTSMEAMNNFGLEVKVEIIEAPKTPCFLSNSIFNLLEVRKAISIPEQKAQAIRLPIMTAMSDDKLLSIFRHAFIHASSKQIPTGGNKGNEQIRSSFVPTFKVNHNQRIDQCAYGNDEPSVYNYFTEVVHGCAVFKSPEVWFNS